MSFPIFRVFWGATLPDEGRAFPDGRRALLDGPMRHKSRRRPCSVFGVDCCSLFTVQGASAAGEEVRVARPKLLPAGVCGGRLYRRTRPCPRQVYSSSAAAAAAGSAARRRGWPLESKLRPRVTATVTGTDWGASEGDCVCRQRVTGRAARLWTDRVHERRKWGDASPAVKKLGGGGYPRFENEMVPNPASSDFFFFFFFFFVGLPQCRRFVPPLKNPWRRP